MGHFARECPNGKKNEHTKNSDDEENAEDKAEIQRLIKEEDINIIPEDTDVSEIDKLTGNPRANDGLLFAIPMLAPYTTITTNKYKAKVQPGTFKRGKAAKTVRGLFAAQAGKNFPYEANLIKSVHDNEMTMALVNNCRILAPGLTKI